MDKLVNNCFSTKRLDCDFEKSINELRKTFISKGVSETLKTHVVLNYIEQCLHFIEENNWTLENYNCNKAFYKYICI